MKIAIAHYHFERGGVTQVVLNQLRGLASIDVSIEAVYLVHGGQASAVADPPSDLPFEIQSLPVAGLGYDDDSTDRSSQLADAMIQAVANAGGSVDDTVWHIHNHSLGKNASLPGAVACLAKLGWPLLLQLHDFAEDYRPANYRLLIEALHASTVGELESRLYPQAANIHYAALTHRDRDLLESVGVRRDALHLLPNSVVESRNGNDQTDPREAKRKVAALWGVDAESMIGLYPVRGIRRKNVGEMLLWSAITKDTTFGITLSPASPKEFGVYDMWRRFAEVKQLPVRFDVGQMDGISFQENQAAADMIFTSSVAEGFGMVYLESWLANRPLIGRDLAGVTNDFRQAGIEFPGLATSIDIPSDAIASSAEPQIWEAYCSAWQMLPDAFIDALQLDENPSATVADVIDFARLPIGLQARVIDAAEREPELAARIVELNPVFHAASRSTVDASGECIANNAQRVRESYAPAKLATQLAEIYSSLLASERSDGVLPPAHPGKLFPQFADYSSFTPCRTIEL